MIVSFLGKGIYGWKPGDKDVKSHRLPVPASRMASWFCPMVASW